MAFSNQVGAVSGILSDTLSDTVSDCLVHTRSDNCLMLWRRCVASLLQYTVGDKIKFPLCTDSPPTCERSCQQKSPKSRPKVASDFRRTLNVIKKVADLFLSGEKIVCARIQFRPKS